ncbi:MAG: hypothetical protein J1F02_12260 [Lachnospiraceae bacterium]|nr:hypothetical protein [Lachnospiraceae bacterium]
MKSKKWMALALAIAVAGSGTGILAQAMAKNQSKETVKVVQNGETEAAVPTEEPQNTKEKQEYVIERATSEKVEEVNQKRTKADMSEQEAVSRVVEKIQACYGDITVKKITNMGFAEPKMRNTTYRAYVGVVRCKEDCIFTFTINSVTGQVCSLDKITNYVDPEYDDVEANEALDLRVAVRKKQYQEAAKNYVQDKIQDGPVKENISRVLTASYGAKIAGYECLKVLVEVECETTEGTRYSIWMDPSTKEVQAWNIWGI